MINTCTLDELPAPPATRTGWPWTSAGTERFSEPGLPVAWPKISIVTPSYNQAPYLEETIRSILLQNYPNLEFFVIDGGSTDGSVDIIRKYERWLTGWVSERDEGQSHAINKGFRLCTGEIFNWVCSDDLLLPGTLATVGRLFSEHPEYGVVAGHCYCQYDLEPAKSETRGCGRTLFGRLPFIAPIWQPSCFFRRDLVDRPELVRTDLHYCMDRELWTYLHARRAHWHWADDTLSVYRFTGGNKSMTGRRKVIAELDEIYRRYIPERVPLTRWLTRYWLPLVRVQERHPFLPVRLGACVLSRAVSAALRLAYPTDRLRALQREFLVYELW